MILNDLNQILQTGVEKVAQEMAVQISSDLMEQVNFEISSDSKRGDYASSLMHSLLFYYLN